MIASPDTMEAFPLSLHVKVYEISINSMQMPKKKKNKLKDNNNKKNFHCVIVQIMKDL